MDGTFIVVEVEGFVGDDGAIIVVDYDSDGKEPHKEPHLYCVGKLADDGVVRFVDWGYRSIEEARAAWPETVSRLARRD